MMAGIGEASSVIALVKVAGSVIQICGGYISDVKDARQDIERLLRKATTLHQVVERLAKASDPHKVDHILLSTHIHTSIGQCLRDLDQLKEKLQPRTKHRAMKKMGWRALKWPLSKTQVDDQVKRIDSYLIIFNTAIQLDHIAVSQKMETKLDQSQDDQLLRTITYIGDAAHDSYENQRHRQCLEDTRVDLLRHITDWAATSSAKHIFWLRGLAGTGKSTIALTVARLLKNQNVLLASFFFKRGGGDLAHARRVISTIAFQLASQSVAFKGLACEALRQDPLLADSASLTQQYEKLLIGPLRAFQRTSSRRGSVVLVLDALDECDNTHDIRLLLLLLGNTKDLRDLGLQVLVTSRPETPIRLGFRGMKHIVYYELALQDIAPAIVEGDIKKFVAHELERVGIERGLPDSWPNQDKIDAIAARADGLFIYAATVCRYIDGPRQVSVSERLEQVSQGIEAKHKSTEPLDQIYTTVLQNSMDDDYSADESQQITARLRQVIGSVVVLFDNLPAEDLERLILPSAMAGGATVRDILDSLHAIFDVPKDLSKPVRLLHLSLRDFLTDNTRCLDNRFYIDQAATHQEMSFHCLDLMMLHLDHNICNLSSPGALAAQISESTLNRYLSLGLQYACRHWIAHVKVGRVTLEDGGIVYQFIQKFYFYWLEVMSLVGKIPEAGSSIRELESLIDMKQAPSLYSLVNDALRFTSTFGYIIGQAPLQLYYACLLFSPINSPICEFFSSHRPKEIHLRTHVPAEWSACVQTLEGHSDAINSMAISPSDNSFIATGSRDHTVRVWKMQTRIGECQYILEGHTGDISSVAFHPLNTSCIASGSDDTTIRVWNLHTGIVQCRHVFEGHSQRISVVSFSSDGSHLVSGSNDSTIRIWDIQASTSACLCVLEGHTASIMDVQFSHDNEMIASGSYNGKVGVWKMQNNMWACQYILEGHSSYPLSIRLSPDGENIVFTSADQAPQAWDLRTGRTRLLFDNHVEGVRKVAFSPETGRYGYHNVRVWDTRTGTCLRVLEGHSFGINGLAFLFGDSRLVSASFDGTLRLWSLQTAEIEPRNSSEVGSEKIVKTLFSPDASHVASKSLNGVTRVRNVRTGQCESIPEHHEIDRRPTEVTFLPDGSRVAFVSCRTIRVWETQLNDYSYCCEEPAGYLRHVKFSPYDRSVLASASVDEAHVNMTLALRDMETTERRNTIESKAWSIYDMAFSPDRKHIAILSEDAIYFWNVQTNNQEHEIQLNADRRGYMLEFSPDGSQLACAMSDIVFDATPWPTNSLSFTSGAILLYSVTTQTVLQMYDITGRVYRIKFSEDGMGIALNGNKPLPPSSVVPRDTKGQLSTKDNPVLTISRLGYVQGWVTRDSEKILWLPSEYRPKWSDACDIHGDMMVAGSGAGRLSFIRFLDQ